ncbi:MAG TPA: sigma factor [Acidobacteriaceae bacterium]|jgi:RNA polymerase sigma-70 factor (ECF subfamily)|nr:sigma factor [Acidobacteriaceae bacterium]
MTVEDQTSTKKALDNALVLRTLDGDNGAFETLVCRYRRVLISLMRRITGTLEDAEDLAQQAFMKALINLPKFGFR